MPNIRLPSDLEHALSREARQRNTSRAEVARKALTFYLKAQHNQRYTERLHQAALQLGEAETRAFVDDSLPMDNEVLDTVEASPLDVENDNPWWR